MYDDRTISVTLAMAYTAWAVSLGMFGLALALFFLMGDPGRGPVLIAEGACIVSAMAATAHVKHFGEQVCRDVRNRNELADDIRRLRAK